MATFFKRGAVLSWISLGAACLSLGWGLAPVMGLTPRGHESYTKPVAVPEPTRLREWRYIVIHHSGSSAGNESSIQVDHLRRGMENGMAYHFLIGNGTMGLGDGAIVEGRRWQYQLQGGHCHQDFLNQCGIGVCLVGNCNRTAPTAKQIKALAELLLKLQTQFQIPDDNIHGHGQFYGEDSDCPGGHFPWAHVWAKFNEAYWARADRMPGIPAANFKVTQAEPR